MVRFDSVGSSVLANEGRFNPKYLLFLAEKEALVSRAPSQVQVLGDRKYFPILSDGIHSAVRLAPSGSVRYLYVHSLKEGFIDETDKIFLDDADHAANMSKELRDGDVLLSVVGTLGNTALVSSYVQKPCSLPRNIAFIRTDSSLVLPSYLTSFFLSDFARNQCVFSGGGNIQGLLSLTKLKKFIVLVPPMTVQEEIAGLYEEALRLQTKFLERITESLADLENILGIKHHYSEKFLTFTVESSALVKEARWTPSLYSPLVDQEIDRVGEKFHMRPLGDVMAFAKGDEIGSENYHDFLSRPSGALPFARTSDIFNYEVDSFPDFWTPCETFDELAQDFMAGDVIVNNDGRIGFPAMLTCEDQAIFQSHIQRLRTKDSRELPNEYAFLCLLSSLFGEMQFRKHTVIQSTIPTLGNRLARCVIPLIAPADRTRLSLAVREAYGWVAEKKRLVRRIRETVNKIVHETEAGQNHC